MSRWDRLLLRLGLHRHTHWQTMHWRGGRVEAWCWCGHAWPVEMTNHTVVI